MAVHAPQFPTDGITWFNIDGPPPTLESLRGRLVILDFWTLCCINCMHVLPTLAEIERRYPDRVAVISVHSPKFAAERDPAKVEAAIARYGITHPVIHDPTMRMWREYAIKAWPTLGFISPDGAWLGGSAGEPALDKLVTLIDRMLSEAGDAGRLQPAAIGTSIAEPARSMLRHPARLKEFRHGRGSAGWAIADAGHHQIALFDNAGNEIRRIGSGTPGLIDGPADSAAFNRPQGLIAAPGAIYVADTWNHALRRIDIATGAVTTLAGTGRRGPVLDGPMTAADASLASPWDLEYRDGRVFIANAGTHQLLVFDIEAGTVARLAGSGVEALIDGPADTAALAQPSGLALRDDMLWFIDSETSSLRRLDLATGMVSTLVGEGLFDYGHIDGPRETARFQHPLGLCFDMAGNILVADAYNDAIRVVDPETGAVSSLDDPPYDCFDDLCRPLSEPAGVAVDDDGVVFVADTNNNRIFLYHDVFRTSRTWAE
ncbi:thioredoxin-like domain-containing protein [Tistrella bauzanensis]|uniref:thioredoxin-like domain-containing protein n=1 Tax=Tistrella TaxID=171436 RepID=UPI0031F6B1E8